MKKSTMLPILILILIAACSSAFAVSSEERISQREECFHIIDTNSDKSRSREEFFALWKKGFRAMDRNKDGGHDRSEQNNASLFASFDTNQDGKISPEEDHAVRIPHFGFRDRDKSGSLSFEEFVY